MREPLPDLRQIRMLITDVDGVLTDGGMYYSSRGEELKRFNTRDGMGFELLKRQSIIPVILTKENSPIVIRRAEKLQVEEVHIGVSNKLERAGEISGKHGISLDDTVFIGDDLNDIPLLEQAGFSCCPGDATDEVKKIVHYICRKKGGEGAVREVVDLLLESRKPGKVL
jgi:3-deoxy-D-manno-octulosonate 8-phosphate phosphatase (KDO 8-P phosphatase)